MDKKMSNIIDRMPEITRRNFEEMAKIEVNLKPKEPPKPKPENPKNIRARKDAKLASEMLNPNNLDDVARNMGVMEAVKLRNDLIKEVLKYDLNG